MATKRFKVGGFGPYVHTGFDGAVFIDRDEAGSDTERVKIDQDGLQFHSGLHTASRVLSLNGSGRSQTVSLSNFVTSSGATVTITDNAGSANLEVAGATASTFYHKGLQNGTYAYWSDQVKFPFYANLRIYSLPADYVGGGGDSGDADYNLLAVVCQGITDITYRKNTDDIGRFCYYNNYSNTAAGTFVAGLDLNPASYSTGSVFYINTSNGKPYLYNKSGDSIVYRFEITEFNMPT